MRNPFSAVISAISRTLFPESSLPEAPVPDLDEAVKAAMIELDTAENQFNFVSEPDLIDHAIYSMEASKKRYSYLLSQMRHT